MKTLTIKISDLKVLELIQNLEDLGLIQVIDYNAETTIKLSTLLSGCISQKQAAKMQKKLKQMRNQ